MADILGISAFYHDSAACLVRDGAIVAAAQEERFTRKKHDAGFPSHAVRYCLREGGVSLNDTFYDKPLVKCERLIEDRELRRTMGRERLSPNRRSISQGTDGG